MIRCKECEYPADDIFDLGEHVYEFHGEHEKNSLECHYCDEKFQSKRDLMVHRKEAHIEKVTTCYYFLKFGGPLVRQAKLLSILCSSIR